ncbi:MAG TPA: MerR family transcriptional regulator [Bryobacteraceae bacterium]|nr:MerR family transcriptional regulator [Bryobacteraceae bacterium]
MTVTALARSCGLSRSTVLYYESIGLLRQVSRTAGNYRAYGERDLARLRQICVFRGSGLKLEDIRALLDGGHSDAASVLERRLNEIGTEIERLRSHQHAIVRLLQKRTSFRRNEMVTKDKLVGIMRAAGLTEDDMKRFHKEFEKSAPAEHQEFLEFLHISGDEIKHIREWSRE